MRVHPLGWSYCGHTMALESGWEWSNLVLNCETQKCETSLKFGKGDAKVARSQSESILNSSNIHIGPLKYKQNQNAR